MTALDCTLPSALSTQRSELDLRARMVERINRLYHEWTADRFDEDHAARHRIEAPFWQCVGRTVLGDSQDVTIPRQILDIASGSGFVLDQLQPYLKASDSAIGVDLSHRSLDRARAKTSKGAHDQRLTWAVASGTQLPLPSRCLSLVTTNASLHHFEDLTAVLREVDRVLDAGGVFAIGFEPNAAFFRSTFQTRIAAFVNRLTWYAHSARNHLTTTRNQMNGSDRQIAQRIARQLVTDRICEQPLPSATILDLLDRHARCNEEHQGIDFPKLLKSVLPHYTIERTFTCDFAGTGLRNLPLTRRIIDGFCGLIAPNKGCLCSYVLRKPEART